MGIGHKLERLATLLEPDIRRILDKQATRTAGSDDPSHDAALRLVTYRKEGTLLWRADAELVGHYSGEFRSFRWWWHGLGARTVLRSRMDSVIGEGQRYGIEE